MVLLKQLRIEVGLTRAKMAKKMGCHPQQIYSFETGRATMPIKYVKKAALILNTDYNFLMRRIIKRKELGPLDNN